MTGVPKAVWLLRVDEDAIATAVQAHAPDRAVAIWKNKAERLIAQVKPSAYQEAAKYLRKAGRSCPNRIPRSNGINTWGA